MQNNNWVFFSSMQRCFPAQLLREPRYKINICDYIWFKALAFHLFLGLYWISIVEIIPEWDIYIKFRQKIKHILRGIKCKLY